jgi:hypothetical protein
MLPVGSRESLSIPTTGLTAFNFMARLLPVVVIGATVSVSVQCDIVSANMTETAITASVKFQSLGCFQLLRKR